MRSKFIFILFSLVLTLSFGSFERVWACSCYKHAPVCEAFGDAKAVFVGTVIEGKRPERMSDMFKLNSRDLNFVFKVTQNFLGTEEEEEITINTGLGFGDCGFPFQKGETYLVYAYEYEGKLKTSICTRTRHVSTVEDDFEDLKYLLLKSGAKIYGKVTHYAKSSLEKNYQQPMSKLKLQVEQLDEEKKKFETITDIRGKYEITGLPTGKYKIRPILPIGLMVEDYETSEFLLNEKGCSNKDFFVKNDSRISGKVIDSEGKPVKSIWVELIPANLKLKPSSEPRETGLTDSNGTFTEYNVPAGKYIIAFNYVNQPSEESPFPTSFYKNTPDRSNATVIEVGLGQKIENLIIQLPPRLKQQEVLGVVVWADGKPASDIYIGLRDTFQDYSVSNSETDKAGNFILKGFIGKKYYINAGKYEEIGEREFQSSGKSPVFTLDKNTKSFRIVLTRKQVK